MKLFLSYFFLNELLLEAFTLELINQWNFLSFEFPTSYNVKNFRPENTVFTGIEVTDDRIFISIPRLREGVPAVLATIPRNSPRGSSPVLQAYPDWSLHDAANGNYNCSGLISVYRTRTDSCNRLWVLDSGTVNSIDNFMSVCPPKILIFDIQTDQIVRTIVFPKEVLRPVSVFTNLIIDESVNGKCDASFVYISDTIAPGIVVYDSSTDKTWRFSDPSMFPDPDYANINIIEDQFVLMDGVIGLAHSSQTATLFYQAVATDRIYRIPTSALTKGPPAEFEALPVTVAGRKSSQGLPLAMNQNDNTLFFAPFSETSLASWNILSNQQKVIATDPATLQFISDLRWKAEDDSLYLLGSRFHKFFKRTVNGNEINLRIFRLPRSSEYQLKNNFRTIINPIPAIPSSYPSWTSNYY